MLQYLSNLESLDLSYTLNIGSVKMLTIHPNYNSTLQAMCHMPNLTELDLSKFQVIGQRGYYAMLDPYQAFNCSNRSDFPLKRLVLEKNFLGRITPGFSQKFPHLEYLSVAYNILVDGRNVFFVLEQASFHPAIRYFNVSYQGIPPYDTSTNHHAKRSADDNLPTPSFLLELLTNYNPSKCQ